MAKQKKTIKKSVPVLNKCGDCAHGTYLEHLANMDHEGKPICLRCPFKEFNVGRFEKSCENFKKRI